MRESQLKPWIIPVAGFLASGKTTLIVAASRLLRQRGLKCAAILNDQGANLVDTKHIRKHQITAEEVEGGCFCCRFSELVRCAERLRQFNPNVIFAEPVGSCADLSATVLQPLKGDFRDLYRIGPLTVLVDPLQARNLLDSPNDPDLSYLFRKQIAEADIRVFTKIDLTCDFPVLDAAEVRYVSAVTAEGLSAWVDEVLSGLLVSGAKLLEIDYDRYARAEASLGWLNWHAGVRLVDPLSPAQLIGPLMDNLRWAISDADEDIIHLKLSDDTDSGYLKASITSNDADPRAEGDLTASPETWHYVRVNCRVLGNSDTLRQIVLAEISKLPGEHTGACLECFSPKPPEPQRRFTEIVT